MKRFLGLVLILWCPCLIIASLFLKSYSRPILVIGFAIGSVFMGIVATLLGLKKLREEPSRFQLFSFIKKGFKKTPWEEYNGYEIIALAVLVFLAAGGILAIGIFCTEITH